ncbi:hypothetical protein FOZ63_014261 [Perkinsus olseni]|uniref:Uncharacterized protein n=1 Tax=Perkinsus olseni TaxID=32597 RepID=A0A7J6RCK9_PEROL|nr:hypothetical protein FOZ62_007702 [Perkinsus olseni]KAF4688806.1 hypothetical protein FOZ60_002396 [Perkinsus olseni]KAF4718539.1 hypothetical protein FOZ63_014261 [Perkinsus olseni]
MSAPTPSITKFMLLSSAALWTSILAGLRYGGTYRNHIIGSALFELEDDVLAIGSEGRIEFTTGDMAIGSNVTWCRSPWLSLKAFTGEEEIEGVPTAVSRYRFIPKPGDSLAYDNFTRCVFEATQLSRSFSVDLVRNATPYVLIDIGKVPDSVIRIPLTERYQVRDARPQPQSTAADGEEVAEDAVERSVEAEGMDGRRRVQSEGTEREEIVEPADGKLIGTPVWTRGRRASA